MEETYVTNNTDKLALIKLAESVVNHLKQSKTNEQISLWLKEEFSFTDEFIGQLI